MTETTASGSGEASAPASAPVSTAPTESAPAPTSASVDPYAGSAPSESAPSSPEASTSQPEGIIHQLYNAEGGLSENYTDLLKENGMESLSNTVAKYKSADGLLKGAANLVNFAGKKVEGVVVPNEGSSEADVAEFRKAIGVPESATAYDLRPENIPDGMDWDNQLAGDWSNVFHEAGLSQEQGQKLAQAYSDITNTQLKQANATLGQQAESSMQEQQAQLQKEWGRGYEQNLQSAVDMAEVVGFDMENAGDMEAMRHPKVMNLLLAKSQSMQEGTIPRNGAPTSSGYDSPQAKADQIYQKHNGQIHLAPPEVQKAYAELRKLGHQQAR